MKRSRKLASVSLLAWAAALSVGCSRGGKPANEGTAKSKLASGLELARVLQKKEGEVTGYLGKPVCFYDDNGDCQEARVPSDNPLHMTSSEYRFNGKTLRVVYLEGWAHAVMVRDSHDRVELRRWFGLGESNEIRLGSETFLVHEGTADEPFTVRNKKLDDAFHETQGFSERREFARLLTTKLPAAMVKQVSALGEDGTTLRMAVTETCDNNCQNAALQMAMSQQIRDQLVKLGFKRAEVSTPGFNGRLVGEDL